MPNGDKSQISNGNEDFVDIEDIKETEKRDTLLYQMILDRFNYEWSRTSQIDSKANILLGFTGIILTLVGGLFTYVLTIPKTGDGNIIILSLFALAISSIVISFYFSHKAFKGNLDKLNMVPTSEELIKYGEDDESKINIVRLVSINLSGATQHNTNINDDKILNIKNALNALGLGIAFTFLVIMIVLVKWW